MLLRSPRASVVFPISSLHRSRLLTIGNTVPPFFTNYTTFITRGNMASLGASAKKHKVTVVGSGNWGSAIAKIVAENVREHPELFEKQVQMWVYEETVSLASTHARYDASDEMSTKPQKLTELINHFHENVKYLPQIPLPHNIIANPSLVDSVKDSTILIFNLPHQFIGGICGQLRGHIAPYARGVSCIKGVNVSSSNVSLFSESIGSELGIYCGALSGANIATEVAQEKFSETTVAYDPPQMDSQNPTPEASQLDLTKMTDGEVPSGASKRVQLQAMPKEYPPVDHTTLHTLFHRPYFHVRMVHDVAGVSICGALKNIVAIGAGSSTVVAGATMPKRPSCGWDCSRWSSSEKNSSRPRPERVPSPRNPVAWPI